MPPERPIVTTVPDDEGNLIPVYADEQQTELNDILTDLVGPLQQQIVVNEAELSTVYRPLIAEQSVYVDRQRDAIDQLIVQTLSPLRGELSAIGYEMSVIINDYEINPEELLREQPQPTEVAVLPVTTDVAFPAADDTLHLPTKPLSGSNSPHPTGSRPIGFDSNRPYPPDCYPITVEHTARFPLDDAFRSNTWRSFFQVVRQGPQGEYYTYAFDRSSGPGSIGYLWTVNAQAGFKPVEGPIPGLFHYLCPEQSSVYTTPLPTQEPTQTGTAFDPTQATIDTLFGSNLQSDKPSESIPSDFPRGILGVWSPCDPDFPEELERLIAGLTKVGRMLTETVTGTWESMATLLELIASGQEVAEGVTTSARNELLDVIGEFSPTAVALKGVAASAKGAAELNRWVANIVRTAVKLQRDLPLLLEPGRGEVLIGAWLTRALFNALTDIRLGWSLGPEFLSNVRVEITQINIILEHVINYIWPVKPMELSDIMSCYSTNDIGENHAKTLVEMHGYDWRCQTLAAYSRRQQATDDQIMSLFLRGEIDRGQFLSAMRGKGWLNPADVATFESSYVFIPPPSDAIRFAVRDVFDPNKLGRAEMEAELRQQKGLMEALAAVGIKKTTIKPEGFEPLEYDVPLAYWLASFEEASPTQVYLGLQRLRPNRVDRYKQVATDAEIAANPALTAGATVTPGPKPGTKYITPNPVTINTVNKLLKEKDYNPIWRSMLAAISYRVTGRIDTKRFYKLGAFGPQRYTAGFAGKPGEGLKAVGPAEIELFESFQDQGYSPDDAIVHAYAVAAELEQSAGLQRRKAERSLVCQAYTEGVYDRNTAIDTLVATGLTVDDAAAQMDTCDAKGRLRLVRTAKAAVRRGFMGGAFDEQQVRATLKQLGVTDRVISESVKLWQLQRDAQPKEPKANEMCQWVKEGLLTQQQMETRLLNLGYRPDDVVRIVAHCQIGALADAAKVREKRIKADLAEARRRERIIKQQQEETERDLQTAFKAFVRLQTDKNLKEWLLAGLVTPDMVRASYRSRGVSADDVERMLELWMPKEEPEEKENE